MKTMNQFLEKALSEVKKPKEKINWKEFYEMSKDTSGKSFKEYEKKYGGVGFQMPHIQDALKKSKDFKQFMKMIKKFESTEISEASKQDKDRIEMIELVINYLKQSQKQIKKGDMKFANKNIKYAMEKLQGDFFKKLMKEE